MYVNAKTIPVKTIPGIAGEGMKESGGGVNSNMIYLIHCKNLCKCICHNAPPHSTTIKGEKKEQRAPLQLCLALRL
jgi:hypothetical protein